MPEFHQIKADIEGIKQALQEIIDNAQATCALVITQDGEHITHAGDVGFINTTALAALVGGMFSATREVAKIVGEMEFSIMIQQGKKRHIHISLAQKNLMLLVVFEGVEKTGWIKVQVERQSEKISQLVEQVQLSQHQPVFSQSPKSDTTQQTDATDASSTVLPSSPGTDTKPEQEGAELDHFKKYASSLLDEIFGQ